MGVQEASALFKYHYFVYYNPQVFLGQENPFQRQPRNFWKAFDCDLWTLYALNTFTYELRLDSVSRFYIIYIY